MNLGMISVLMLDLRTIPERARNLLSGNWCGPYTLFARTVIRGSLKLLRYALTIISAAALLAEYGFVGASILVSPRSAAPTGTSPYTSSVEICTNLFTPCSLALSSNTCVP